MSNDSAAVSVFSRRAKQSIDHWVSPAERLQLLYQPWKRLVIVPLFALANAGVSLSPQTLADAATSPVTPGVVVGLVLGKLLGISEGAVSAVQAGLGTFAPEWDSCSWPVARRCLGSTSPSRCSSSTSPLTIRTWPTRPHRRPGGLGVGVQPGHRAVRRLDPPHPHPAGTGHAVGSRSEPDLRPHAGRGRCAAVPRGVRRLRVSP